MKVKSEKLRNFAYFFLLLAVVAAGCENTSRKVSIDERNELLLAENELLTESTRKLQAEKDQLTGRLEVLTKLDRDVRLEAIPTLEKIEIASRSGLYDKDKNGSKETLMVYVRTIDDNADAIKIPGSISVQLWNLNAPSDKALLQNWKLAPEEIKKLWSGTFMTSYYRLRFDVSDLAIGSNDELTVNVSFTDYLSGRIAKAQRAIKR